MAGRNLPGVKNKRVGNYSIDELQRLLKDRVKDTSSAPRSGDIDIRTVPGSNERRTGIPADTRSRSARGTLPPGQVVNKSTPALSDKRTPTPAVNTYKARGKTYIANPNDSKKIFLKNHPVLAGLKTTDAKTKFLSSHPRIANRAAEVSKRPALSKKPGTWDKSAVMRRLRKRYKLGV